MFLRLDDRSAGLDSGFGHLPKRNAPLPEGDLLTRDPGHVQQIINEPDHVMKLTFHDFLSGLHDRQIAGRQA